ncbi:hypothetical protein [Roseibium sp. RKSG952]|uniref:hypothetical protein n=1 Tax=Roseibium sp. RKSG952 TaxID=2529384 RepID=UPI0012BC3992|nr:hypothetical protein [Roseibium sp. RKSG952]MTH95192.1 hypothetical protein [Roseibium sp. RKSG952]
MFTVKTIGMQSNADVIFTVGSVAAIKAVCAIGPIGSIGSRATIGRATTTSPFKIEIAACWFSVGTVAAISSVSAIYR